MNGLDCSLTNQDISKRCVIRIRIRIIIKVMIAFMMGDSAIFFVGTIVNGKRD